METENKTTMWWAAIIVFLVIAVVIAVLISRNNTTTGTDTNETRSFTLSEQSDSGQNGTALLEEVGNQLRVTLTLANPSTTAEPAHIHTGSCPTPGGVIFPLDDVVDGTSVTLLDTSIDDLEGRGDLSINVHKSAAESNVYYSCGDLNF